MQSVSVAESFSKTPGGRFKVMGPDSGEEFRQLLAKELKKKPNETFEVILDGAEGYGSSFLEEAFGGLVRLGILKPHEIGKRIRVVAKSTKYETYAREALFYMEDAAVRLADNG